ncbi:hypothetical protein C4K03_3057 [Pseudomonas synxantha]|uniref:Uncharacterized protein n=1 Tax=Pseudomonas synxantha TaxID=47883 RepID=A0A3G7U9B5_9PSED|nr:hypothetical protein C4K03_3057 [Pseudomonas synxantha]
MLEINRILGLKIVAKLSDMRPQASNLSLFLVPAIISTH